MEQLLFEMIYRGLMFEMNRVTKKLTAGILTEIRQHVLLLRRMLQLAAYAGRPEYGGFCTVLKRDIIRSVGSSPALARRYDTALLRCELPAGRIAVPRRAVLLLHDLFLQMGEELTGQPDAKRLEMLFRAGHHLPRCMLDPANHITASEAVCLEDALAAMDTETAERTALLLQTMPAEGTSQI